jgi:hypothetical protein
MKNINKIVIEDGLVHDNDIDLKNEISYLIN